MPVFIYARIRPMLPFEKGEMNILESKGVDLTVLPPPGETFEPKTFSFAAISERNTTNVDCFNLVAKSMCDSVLEGFNAVLVAYGQTGCGKTFTMLGKAPNVVGVIPRALDYLMEHPSAPALEMSVVEAYSRNVMKIELFDLLHDKNQTGADWDIKKGSTTLTVKQATTIKLRDGEHGRQVIEKAQSAGHYAPTGKNPFSSRGHCMFLVKVIPESTGTTMVDPSTFIFVDLAGSEGETALTPAFCAAHTQEVVLMRRMEGDVINNGLSAIQSIFRELGKNGKVAKRGKIGVRRILLDYINANTTMSVMFMLSPAAFNVGPTTSTLYFAKSAALVKVKPQKKKARVNCAVVAELQKAEIEELTKTKEEFLACLGGNGTYMPSAPADGAAPAPYPAVAAPKPEAKKNAAPKVAPAAEAAPAAAAAAPTNMVMPVQSKFENLDESSPFATELGSGDSNHEACDAQDVNKESTPAKNENYPTRASPVCSRTDSTCCKRVFKGILLIGTVYYARNGLVYFLKQNMMLGDDRTLPKTKKRGVLCTNQDFGSECLGDAMCRFDKTKPEDAVNKWFCDGKKGEGKACESNNDCQSPYQCFQWKDAPNFDKKPKCRYRQRRRKQ